MFWWVIAGMLAIETAIPLLWWSVRQSVSGIWYIVGYTWRGRSEKAITAEEAIILLGEKEAEIARISGEIRDIKAHLTSEQS